MMIAEIREMVRHMRPDEHINVETNLAPRRMWNQLGNLQDDGELQKHYRCEAVDGGVRIKCVGEFKFPDITLEKVERT